MPTRPTRTSNPSGRPTTDVALLSRNRLWAWMVYNTSSESSWDGLDRFWLPKIDKGTPIDGNVEEKRDRRRVFYRIFHQATDPASTRGLTGKTLVQAVRESGLHPDAMAMYDSPLWRMVGPHPPLLAQIASIQNELIEMFGLFEATDLEISVAKTLGINHWALSEGDLEHLRIAAARIARHGTADAIALLGCLFQRALDHLSLEEASVYLKAIDRAYRKMNYRWLIQPEVATSLHVLIRIRLIRRLHEPIEPGVVGFWVRSRRKKSGGEPDTALLWSRMKRSQRKFPPVVAIDHSLQEFVDNFPQLLVQAERPDIDFLTSTGGRPDDL